MESVVGTGLGTAHNLRQGEGLATVLVGDSAVDTYRRIADREWVDAQRRDADRRARRDAALARLRTTDPEFFYKHNAEKEALQRGLLELGTTIAMSNKDPFTDVTPDAVEFQKRYSKLMSMSQASMQLKQQFVDLQKELMGGKDVDYAADDVSKALAFYDLPLEEIVTKGLVPPTLQKKAPMLEMSQFIGKNMATWQKDTDKIPTDNEIDAFVNALASDADNKQKFVAGYGSKLMQMDEEERKSLEARARAGGRETWQQMAFEDAKRWQKQQTPLDMLAAYNKAADLAAQGVSYKEWRTPDAYGSAPVKGSKDAAIKQAANALFNSDDRWLTVFDESGELPRGSEETDKEYAARVKNLMAGQIAPLVKTRTESGQTDRGGDKKKLEEGRRHFIEDMRSGDPVRMQAAANILTGTDWIGSWNIEGAKVVPTQLGYSLELDLGTNVSPKQVTEKIADPTTGIEQENVKVENRQGRTVAYVRLDPEAVSNQTLLSLHDRLKKPYEAQWTERSSNVYDATGAAPKVIVPLSQPQKNQNNFMYGADYFNK